MVALPSLFGRTVRDIYFNLFHTAGKKEVEVSHCVIAYIQLGTILMSPLANRLLSLLG